MRTQSRLPRRLGVVAGLSAIAAMGMIMAGCAKEEEKAPETSTTTSSNDCSPRGCRCKPPPCWPNVVSTAPAGYTVASDPAAIVVTSSPRLGWYAITRALIRPGLASACVATATVSSSDPSSTTITSI